jgi:hypothetical protein
VTALFPRTFDAGRLARFGTIAESVTTAPFDVTDFTGGQ